MGQRYASSAAPCRNKRLHSRLYVGTRDCRYIYWTVQPILMGVRRWSVARSDTVLMSTDGHSWSEELPKPRTEALADLFGLVCDAGKVASHPVLVVLEH